MLKKIALAAVLVQVAAFSALITQTILFASAATQAASTQPSDPVAVTGEGCAKATPQDSRSEIFPIPNTPDHCLKRIEPRKLITTTLIIAGRQ
ncbi:MULTISPECIES: hypothetical protein [unclassified Mesorhizobium]|uniref:hypothetical protein n=1 Tax=unclassified Mesorhizobium TaxID=325217 RepID=UPI0003CEDA64|nr:hypothetical protein [Mesorhizobium sp. LNHC252B00]ESY75051.1 hypothetical protein X743_05365 [Mesorhizobium sp. LNHC252B00]